MNIICFYALVPIHLQVEIGASIELLKCVLICYLGYKSFVFKDFTLWLKVYSENITAAQLRERVVSFSSSCISLALCNVSELNAAEHFTQYQVKLSILTKTISIEIVCLKLSPTRPLN